jgi:hypothetical protein
MDVGEARRSSGQAPTPSASRPVGRAVGGEPEELEHEHLAVQGMIIDHQNAPFWPIYRWCVAAGPLLPRRGASEPEGQSRRSFRPRRDTANAGKWQGRQGARDYERVVA